MAEENSQESENIPVEELPITAPPKSHLITRFACGILLIIWFMLLLTPCAFIYLASNGEIRIWHADIPEPEVHPLLLIQLVSEINSRGFHVETSTIVDSVPGDNLLCVQTTDKFLLWQSKEKNLDAVYCECYARESVDEGWSRTDMLSAECQP